jgi:hypothetical protein
MNLDNFMAVRSGWNFFVLGELRGNFKGSLERAATIEDEIWF